MKNNKLFTIAILLIFNSSLLLSLDVSVSSLVFYDNSPYLEIYSRIISKSVQYSSPENDLSNYFSEIEYLILIKKDDSIIIADKYQITSPKNSVDSDFWDLKRYGLTDGDYSLSLRYVDLNNTKDTFLYEEQISILPFGKNFTHSDILFTADVDTSNVKYSFSKAGFYYEPLSFNLVKTKQNKLIFYTELYHTDALIDEPFFVKYFIESQEETDLQTPNQVGYKKLYPSVKESLLFELDVKHLPSGNYKLYLELNSKAKEVLSVFNERFSVYHPIVDINNNVAADALFETSFVQLLDVLELDYSLKAILPKVGNNVSEALNFVIAGSDLISKRYFLYNFWSQISSDNMKAHYDKYMEVARAVDKEFSNNVGFGFESDRGYYFLKYGRPSDMVSVEDEPSAPPYEIWIYNHMPSTQQTNVKFLFYNPSLASNDYILLHSTCRGERSNPRWEVDLYSDATNENTQNYLNAKSMPDNWNRNARRYFTDF